MPNTYFLGIIPKAQKELDDIPDGFFSKIDKQIRSLSSDPRPFGVQKLDKNLHRIRVGNYRVIYSVLDKEEKIIILHVARRNEKTYRDI